MKLLPLLYEQDDFDTSSTLPWGEDEIAWCTTQLKSLEYQEKRLRRALDATENLLTDADDDWSDNNAVFGDLTRVDVWGSLGHMPKSIFVPTNGQNPKYSNLVIKIVRNINRTIAAHHKISDQLTMAIRRKKGI